MPQWGWYVWNINGVALLKNWATSRPFYLIQELMIINEWFIGEFRLIEPKKPKNNGITVKIQIYMKVKIFLLGIKPEAVVLKILINDFINL